MAKYLLLKHYRGGPAAVNNIPNIVHFDFDTALMLREDPVTGGIVYKENGVVEVPEAIGLGATISEEWLAKWEKVVVG